MNLKNTALLAILIAVQTGCGFNKVPDCSNRQVQSTLRDLMMGQLLPMLLSTASSEGADFDGDDVPFTAMYDLKQLKALASHNPTAAKMLKVAGRKFDEMVSPLRDIRTVRTAKEVRKAWCEARVDMTMREIHTSVAVAYSVQFMDDGQLYVEYRR